MLIAWRGSIVMDLPKNIGGKPVDSLSSVKLDGIVYNITGWKPDGADESAEMMKVFYEKDTMKYADEVLRSYLVTFGPDDTLNVTVKLRSGEMTAPVLAITGGDKTKLAYVSATANDDGSYTYALPVSEALTEAGKWYDLRFFMGTAAYEMLKDSCITYSNCAAKYTVGAKTYEFREYNGILKLMFSDAE